MNKPPLIYRALMITRSARRLRKAAVYLHRANTDEERFAMHRFLLEERDVLRHHLDRLVKEMPK